MKKAIICYHSNEMSNSIASSTMSKLEVNPIAGLTVERKDINKINLIKYLKKKKEENDLPNAIYMYEYRGRSNQKNNLLIEKIEEEFPEINIEIYSNKLMYIPQRVPGNKLKTRVYLLAERMKYDYKSEYEKLNVYKVNTSDKSIKEIQKSTFDMYHPKGESFKCYTTYDEALMALENHMKSYENAYSSRVKKAKEELRIAEINLQNAQNETLKVMAKFQNTK